MLDSITQQLLAGAVTDVTNARNRTEATADHETVALLNQALMRLSTIEARLDAPVTYRMRHNRRVSDPK